MSSEPGGVTVATVLRDVADSGVLDLELLAGAAGVERRITIPHTQKTGLALSGFDAYLRPGRVLVFGRSELHYLETLTTEERAQALRRVFSHDLPCLLVTGGGDAPAEAAGEADRTGVPLLRTRPATPDAPIGLLGTASDPTLPLSTPQQATAAARRPIIHVSAARHCQHPVAAVFPTARRGRACGPVRCPPRIS